MRPNQLGLNHPDLNESDIPAAIPDLARAWESGPRVASAVRRPSTLPDPELYHEVIDPQAIFELDEKQADGSIETILVVPFGCQRCKSFKQACSRARPACVRCKKADVNCEVVQGSYQRLPRPKTGRPLMMGKRKTSGTCAKSEASSSTQKPTAGQTMRIKRIASGSKRPLSPGSDSTPPRKKTQVKTQSRKGKTRCDTVASSDEMDTESELSGVGPSAPVPPTVVSDGKRSALKWAFVNNSRVQDETSFQGQEHSMPPESLIPRVWTNVRLT